MKLYANICLAMVATAGNWQLTALPNAPNPYTYQVQSITRAGKCADLLAAYKCAYGASNAVTTYTKVRQGRTQVIIRAYVQTV